jgi:tetratricopeptide (TPR) repeat protein
METLYDLLGALPRDDADELRSAFRRAVKGAHPDLNPNDPLAGQKFREIVRANEILGDEDQRAAYDHLLDLAHREERKKKTAKVIHRTASSAIALVAVATFGLGTYGAYRYSPTFAAALNQVAGIVLVQPGDFASVTPQAPMKPQPALEKALAAFAKALPAPSDAQSLPITVVKTEAVIPAPKAPTGSAETTVLIASAEPPAAEKAQTTTDAIVPVVVTSSVPAAQSDRGSTASASVGPPLEISPGDAKVHRERGVFAYRSGDFNAAVAEFDRAIRLDPNFSAAYVDRSIVLYRMQRFERAFADIAQAKRLEKATRAARIAARKKAVEVTAAVGIAPFFQPRTARLEATTP